MLFKSLVLSSLTALVAADYASILASLNTIDADTLKLNTDLGQFGGNIIFALPILGDNLQLNADLVNGTSIANNSTELSVSDAANLVAPVQKLATDVNTTVTNLIAKYPAFKSDDLTGIVLVTLEATQSDANSYSSAVISKIPSNLQAEAQTLIAPINTAFASAIAVYQN